MVADEDNIHWHLNRPERRLAKMAGRPGLLLLLATSICIAAGWFYLLAMIATMSTVMDLQVLGPGMFVFGKIFGQGAAATLVDHTAVHGLLAMPDFGPWGVRDLALIFVMWVMMAFAMMLPTAAPMLATYADLADTAARQREPAASPILLLMGYLLVWIGFALLATLLQWGLTELRFLSPIMDPAQTVLAGTTIVAAGLYQFTPAKKACLAKCQSPFPFFLARWTDRPAGIFRLGVEQGMFCLGCCWALMLVMFAVGVMNAVWIAGLAVLMAVEKTVIHRSVAPIIGAVFCVWGGLVLLFSEPGRSLCGF